MPVIGVVDVANSQQYLRLNPEDGPARIEERKKTIKRGFSGLTSYRQIGDDQGDGFTFAVDTDHAVDLLQRAVYAQDNWRGGDLPVHIALAATAQAVPGNLGESYPVRGLVERLKGACPERAVAFDQAIYGLLEEHPQLRERAVSSSDHLKGYGDRGFWIIYPAGSPSERRRRRSDRPDAASQTIDDVRWAVEEIRSHANEMCERLRSLEDVITSLHEALANAIKNLVPKSAFRPIQLMVIGAASLFVLASMLAVAYYMGGRR
jgi:hypothetical protein